MFFFRSGYFSFRASGRFIISIHGAYRIIHVGVGILVFLEALSGGGSFRSSGSFNFSASFILCRAIVRRGGSACRALGGGSGFHLILFLRFLLLDFLFQVTLDRRRSVVLGLGTSDCDNLVRQCISRVKACRTRFGSGGKQLVLFSVLVFRSGSRGGSRGGPCGLVNRGGLDP